MPETTTTRSFEIPACGAFMLAERTKEHLELFKEEKEAEFFFSRKELVEKVHYYLEHPQKRKDIAAAGRKRCVNSGYSFQDRLKDILEKVQEIR
jgi:spore maturation protein CgeB